MPNAVLFELRVAVEQSDKSLAEQPVAVSQNDRDEHGHFQAEHDDREYLAVVAEREPDGTAEIADVVGVTR